MHQVKTGPDSVRFDCETAARFPGVFLSEALKVYFLFGSFKKVYLFGRRFRNTSPMGRKKKRPVSIAKIDTAVLKYIRKTYGNVNDTLVKTFPEADKFLIPEVDPNQLQAEFPEEVVSQSDGIIPSDCDNVLIKEEIPLFTIKEKKTGRFLMQVNDAVGFTKKGVKRIFTSEIRAKRMLSSLYLDREEYEIVKHSEAAEEETVPLSEGFKALKEGFEESKPWGIMGLTYGSFLCKEPKKPFRFKTEEAAKKWAKKMQYEETQFQAQIIPPDLR